MTMILQDLNSDCLEYIFKYIDFNEQLELALLSAQFKNVLGTMWMRKYVNNGKLSCKDNIEKVDLMKHQKGLELFASVVCEHTEELFLSDNTVMNVMLLRRWPSLRILKIRVDFNDVSEHIQFFDQQYPVLTELNMVRDVTDVKYATRFIRRLREKGPVCTPSCELNNFQVVLNTLREFPRSQDKHLDEVQVFLSEIKKYRDRVKQFSYNYLWTQTFNTLEGKRMQNPRILKVSGFDARVLGLELMPHLQELYLRNPIYERTDDEKKAIYEILSYVTDCVRLQLKAKTRLLPLEVFFCHSTDFLSPPIYAISKIPDWLQLTGNPLPANHEYFDVWPFSFQLECEW